MPVKVCHVTSAHRSNDTRIFHKECISLAKAGYEVYLVANGNSYTKEGVHVIGIGKHHSKRMKRMLHTSRKIFKAAVNVDADIYHLHDPELLQFALKLKRKGKKVIFDSHEDYLLTISGKRWIPNIFKSIVVLFYVAYEKFVCSKLDGIVVCYHWTEERMKKYCEHTMMILNYPIIDNNKAKPSANFNNKRAISFAGGITAQWCHKQILEALGKLTGVRYELAGKLVGKYGLGLQEMKEWELVKYHGVLSIEKYFQVYANSSIGIALLDYIPQCKGTAGNLSNTKFYDMYAGLPLLCTDFILWKEIIEKEQCGICVNP